MTEQAPPWLGGDDPWHYLQPEGQETLDRLSEEGKQQRMEVGLAFQRCFANAAGHEALHLIREQARSIPTFVPGWSTEQLAPCLIRRQAILDMCDWIEQQMSRIG